MLFRLILRNIQGLQPLIDDKIRQFIIVTTKNAIYIQIITINAADNDISLENFELQVSELKDTDNNEIDFTFESTTTYQSLHQEIKSALNENYQDIADYITTQLRLYLGNATNGYDDINTTNLAIEITDISDSDTSEIDTQSTTKQPTANDQGSSKSGTDDIPLEIIYYIAGALVVITCCIITCFCCVVISRKSKSSKENKKQLELNNIHKEKSPSQQDMLPPTDTENTEKTDNTDNERDGKRQNIIQDNKSSEVEKQNSGIGSDNDVIDGDLNTDLRMIHSGDDADYDSDPQSLEEIQHTIHVQQQKWIEQQIRMQQQQQKQMKMQAMNGVYNQQQQQQMNQFNAFNGMNNANINQNDKNPQQLFAELPPAPSEVTFAPQHTARMSLDPNGVPELLNADDQSEIDAYNEGVGSEPIINEFDGIDDEIDHVVNGGFVNDDNPNEDAKENLPQNQLGDKHDNYQIHDQYELHQGYNQYRNNYGNQYGNNMQYGNNQYQQQYYNNNNYNNNYGNNNYPLPSQPEVNNNIYSTPAGDDIHSSASN